MTFDPNDPEIIDLMECRAAEQGDSLRAARTYRVTDDIAAMRAATVAARDPLGVDDEREAPRSGVTLIAIGVSTSPPVDPALVIGVAILPVIEDLARGLSETLELLDGLTVTFDTSPVLCKASEVVDRALLPSDPRRMISGCQT